MHAELNRRARGDAVEAAALAYLQRHGLQPLARNANSRGGELDLVMREGAVVVFCLLYPSRCV